MMGINNEETEIKHFLHEHPLKILDIIDEDKCFGCKHPLSSSSSSSGETYGCLDCKIFLHKSCANLSQEIQLFFHPCSLFLSLSSSYSSAKEAFPHRYTKKFYSCSACHKSLSFSGFIYRCEHCDFSLHVNCAITVPTIVDETKQIQHFCHWHPLTIFENKENNSKAQCQVCEGHSSGAIYECSQCNFYIHKSCMDILPRNIHHLFHPCLLILQTPIGTEKKCYSCYDSCSHLTFRCGPCDYNLDVKCALLPSIKTDNYRSIRANWHEHALTFYENVVSDEVSCGACKKKFSSGPTYGCDSCRFFLHKYCFEFPQKIQSRFHLQSPLCLMNLSSSNTEKRRCNLCLKECSGFAFSIPFSRATQLHIECASQPPTVKFRGHSHFLNFVEKIHGELNCSACNSSFTNSPAFRCVPCDYNLHLMCGPLPFTIKHKSHVDPITLLNFYIEEEDVDDEFYCDVCESPRDPRKPVYYCSEGCPFVSEVECVISEVIATLRGNRGNVKLTSVIGLVPGKVSGFVLQDIELGYDTREKELENEFDTSIKPLSFYVDEPEGIELRNLRAAVKREVEGARLIFNKGEPEEDHRSINSGATPSSKEDFTHFMNKINYMACDRLMRFVRGRSHADKYGLITGETLKFLAKWELLDEILARPYFYYMQIYFQFPWMLISIYEDLFAKYGDIGAKSMLSTNMKVLFCAVLCGVIHRMCTTAIVDLSEDMLVEWLSLLKVVECGGFDVGFIWKHLLQVTRAYFGVYAKRLLDNTLVKQEQEITGIKEEIEKLKVKLEAKEKEHEDYKSYAQSVTTGESFMKQCLDENAAMKWKPAADNLL